MMGLFRALRLKDTHFWPPRRSLIVSVLWSTAISSVTNATILDETVPTPQCKHQSMACCCPLLHNPEGVLLSDLPGPYLPVCPRLDPSKVVTVANHSTFCGKQHSALIDFLSLLLCRQSVSLTCVVELFWWYLVSKQWNFERGKKYLAQTLLIDAAAAAS